MQTESASGLCGVGTGLGFGGGIPAAILAAVLLWRNLLHPDGNWNDAGQIGINLSIGA